jgi:Coenzyme PQQ synthesis protein D (PqqD)
MTVEAPPLLINDSVVFAEVDNEAVLLNVETGVYFGLDEIGTEIWNLLSAGASEGEVVDKLLREYEVGLEQLSTDVGDFIAKLESHGLVRRTGQS